MIDVFFGNDAIWFSAVAFAGTAIFVLRLLLMLVGVGDLDGGDADFAAEGDPSIGLLSLNGIAGILMGFGYGALISYRSIGWGFLPSIVVGLVCGLAVGWMIAMMFHSMKKLENSGNIDSKDAVGKSAAVYTTIPDDPNSRGRVRVIIDGRMRYFSARSETGSFARGSQVHISSMDDDRTVLVESQQSDSTK
jgi:membrane protein implicated in regulation of membrane protease activity